MAKLITDKRYPLMSKIDTEDLTPMMQQYFEIKRNYLDYILFYRLGDFYEMFFDDAVKVAPMLEIALTARGTIGGEKVPMCGVPFHALETYLRRAFDAKLRIAICEQQEPPKGTTIVKREVTRIITPGTVFNPELLDSGENNFVAAVLKEDDARYRIEYCDITTGVLKRTVVDASLAIAEMMRIAPAEVLYYSTNLTGNMVVALGATTDLAIIDAMEGKEDTMLESYLAYTAKQQLEHIHEAEEYHPAEKMLVDPSSIRNLELLETMMTKEKKGSLLWVLDQTKTSMGARLLKENLKAPLVDVEQIRARLDFVESLVSDYWVRSEMRSTLSEIYDIERLVSKLVYDTVTYRDLVSIKTSLKAVEALKAIGRGIEGQDAWFAQLDPLESISELLEHAIADGGEGFKQGYSAQLDEEYSYLLGGKERISELEQREKQATGIRTLKIGYNKVFGYYIDVSKSFVSQVPAHYIRKQTLVNAERFITEELKAIEDRVLGAQDKVSRIEKALFDDIKHHVRQHISTLQRDAAAVAILDVLASFAEVSYVRSYHRPEVDTSEVLRIKDGRHPVIECLSEFIPNDTDMDTEQRQIYILTGPNMAGKSSYLRQNALIILMAQMGCFVPAKEAQIGVVDRIFTRVGASDDLSQGQSTFMVEMKELSGILKNMTPKSFLILDEIGRGTSTFDGLSIAWAVLEYLSDRSARTMFATHYHELTQLQGNLEGVLNYRISVKKQGEDILFLRKIVQGGESHSYGIEVAKLAGLPETVVRRARDILSELDRTELNLYSLIREKEPRKDAEVVIQDSPEMKRIKEMLLQTDLNDLSPKMAWQMLEQLIQEAKSHA